MTQNLDYLFNDILTESEFSDDLKAIYGDSEEVSKIPLVLNTLKNIRYGFINKQTGEPILDRDFIHNCRNLRDIYDVEKDPEKTIERKLGICTDQSYAAKYLFNKHYPDIPCEMYALTTGRFGHCVPCFNDHGNWYYLENAWDKEKGLWGPYPTEDALKRYLESVYHKNHDQDTGFAPVKVRRYEEYLKECQALNESFVQFK